MTKTVSSLLGIIGILTFTVGLLLGQQMRRSKFDAYLHGSVTPMDIAVLRANTEVVRGFISLEIPNIYYNASCACFTAHATVTSELAAKPLEEVRARLTARAQTVRRALEYEFPELSKSSPDRDFKMTFYELNLKNPDASHDLADYVDGKIVFK
jgi:hypothetical protein